MQRRVIDRRILSNKFINFFWMDGWINGWIQALLEGPMVIAHNEGADAIMGGNKK